MCASLIAALAIGALPATPVMASALLCFSGANISLSQDSASTVYGDNVAYNAAVTPTSATGSVQFWDDADGAGPLPAVAIDGPIPLSSSYNTAGIIINNQKVSAGHVITAQYIGNTIYCTVTSASVSHAVTPKTLLVGPTPIVNPTTRVYDRSVAVAFTGGTLVGVIAPDVVTLTQTGNMADWHVGVGKPVTPNFSLGGADAGNYTLTQPAGPFVMTITAKPLYVDGITASNKVYDATTAAIINTTGAVFRAGGVILGDSVTLIGVGLTGTFANKNVGVGKVVTIAGYSLAAGLDNTNYALQPVTTTANISPALITLNPVGGGVVINPRPYNTTNVVSTFSAASYALGALDGELAGDVVTLVPGAGTYNNANAGLAKPVVLTGFTLGGADGGNYTLFAQPSGITGDITIAVTALCLDNPGPRPYNGSPYHADLMAKLVNCGGIQVPGTFTGITYAGSATPPTNVGTYPVDADFTSPAPLNYPSVAYAAAPNPIGTMVIFKIDPFLAITNSPTPYTGTPRVVIITADVPGVFSNVTYNGSMTAPTAVGMYHVVATFTPTDTTNYNTLVNVHLGDFVIGIVPTLSVTNSPRIYTGSMQSATVIGSVPGVVSNVRYDGSVLIPTDVGTYAVTADFVPTDGATYLSLASAPAGNFVINKATPTATLTVTNTPVTFDGSAHFATVGATSSVPGNVVHILMNGALSQTAIGTYAVTADFVPFNANYNSLIGLSAGNFAIVAPIPVEILRNGGFNLYGGLDKVPTYWSATNFVPTDGKSIVKTEGAYSVRFSGNARLLRLKTLTQENNVSGLAGDAFDLSYKVKGMLIPAAGDCKVQVMFYNGGSLVQTQTVSCALGTYDWTTISAHFNATSAYTKVVVMFTYYKSSGSVWFDAASLVK